MWTVSLFLVSKWNCDILRWVADIAAVSRNCSEITKEGVNLQWSFLFYHFHDVSQAVVWDKARTNMTAMNCKHSGSSHHLFVWCVSQCVLTSVGWWEWPWWHRISLWDALIRSPTTAVPLCIVNLCCKLWTLIGCL